METGVLGDCRGSYFPYVILAHGSLSGNVLGQMLNYQRGSRVHREWSLVTLLTVALMLTGFLGNVELLLMDLRNRT